MSGARDLKAYIEIGWNLALLIALLVAANYAGNWIIEKLGAHLTPGTEAMLRGMIMSVTVAYILLMMLPFVPAAEIGLGMMALFGAEVAPLVYGSTVVALSLAFLVGRLVPEKQVIRAFEFFGLARAADLLREVGDRKLDDRLGFLLSQSSSRFVPFLLRYRFIALMIALNIPGNAVIGGGGGISLTVGFSRLFSFPMFVLAVAIAVAPVPLFMMIAG